MFLKNSFRPAFAEGTSLDKPINNKKLEGVAFSSAETNDFNSFSSSASSKPKRNKPPKRDMTFEINTRSLIIAVASIVAAVLLIILVSSVVSLSNKSIKFENNAFICYKDAEGSYHVSKNGRDIDELFFGETTLTPASDNSFAYITVDTEDGYDVYVLDSGRPKLVCDNVQRVVAYAEFEPGIVFIQNGRLSYHFDDADTVLTSSDEDPENVVVAPDGSAIAYNVENKNNAEILSLYVYHTDDTAPHMAAAASESLVPVSISEDGKYVLAYKKNGEAKELYSVHEGESFKIEGVSGSFDSIIYKNTTDTEVVFTAKADDAKTNTYVFNCKNTGARKGTNATHLASGKSLPQVADAKIVRLDTIRKTYFANLDEKRTFYVDKKYRTTAIAGYLGEFTPDLDYFYFVNEQKQVLCKMEVHNGKTESASSIAYDVEDFKVTEKGNVYYVDRYFDFYFYKLSKEKSSRLASDVLDISFYDYSNDLYFEKYVTEDSSLAYTTSEGADADELKFGKVQITSIPELTNVYSAKTYAFVENDDDTYTIFYTSNGRSFKQIATGVTFED